MEIYLLHIAILQRDRISQISDWSDLNIEKEVGQETIPAESDGEAIEEAFLRIVHLRQIVMEHQSSIVVLPIHLCQNRRKVKSYSKDDMPEDVKSEFQLDLIERITKLSEIEHSFIM